MFLSENTKKWLYIVDTAYQTRFRDTSYAIYEYIHAFETQSTRSDYRVFALRNGLVHHLLTPHFLIGFVEWNGLRS